ncbi:phosphate signaling complex protein PhoU [Bacillus sp. V3B]|uniref:phosphate signaling complex protein PhoU n=1 Tax=Bacillus sp. V3B TaxID=2804915 RepID=UPI00210906E6|nr:phosphate signaling complex protein PhoU [Bacillus sp. V3B]MCQ6273691.1 phosphate signaling complex protein PhoU [Bacillus sp. V3B]
MPVRGKFEGDLKELQHKLTELVKFADQALANSIEALETHNIELALQIMEDDTVANILYEEINEFAVLLIAKQQPVAIDLRRIIIAIKIATDVERIADFAVNIAKSTIRIGQEPHLKPIDHLKKMHEITSIMLKEGLIAYQQEDTKLAKKVAEMDDQVDSLYGETIKELFKLNNEKSDNLPQITQMLFICRFLERAADHVTNIAEYVFYLVKGKHYDLNE